jgi:hypothetical protein
MDTTATSRCHPRKRATGTTPTSRWRPHTFWVAYESALLPWPAVIKTEYDNDLATDGIVFHYYYIFLFYYVESKFFHAFV